MKFSSELIHGVLIRRIKRFMAEVQLDDGSIAIAHCTNSGSMKSCLEEGAEVYLSPVSNPDRWTRYTWEMIRINGDWVGINTSNPNRLVYEALNENQIPGLKDLTLIKKEAVFRDSRFDFYVEKGNEKGFIEVKNVTLKEGEFARFPDAVTERGKKHLLTLMDAKKEGFRAMMIYVIQRRDVIRFAPALEIDPAYGKTLQMAVNEGIEVIPLQVRVTPDCIIVDGILPYDLSII